MIEQTKQMIVNMRLHGMHATFDQRLSEATANGWGHSEFMAAVLTDESLYRANLKTKSRLRNAQFRVQASMERFETTTKRSIKRTQVRDLSQMKWIAEPRKLDQDVFCHDLSQATRQTNLEKRHEYMNSY